VTDFVVTPGPAGQTEAVGDRCEVCGNRYDKSFIVEMASVSAGDHAILFEWRNLEVESSRRTS
jgi:hypothetical protein